MKNTANHTPFTLGDWYIDPETGRISQGDTTVTLEPKVMSLLTLLVSDPGRVFSRQDIEQNLWPNTVVGEDTVARSISKLRRALSDNVQAPQYIETLPKRGYRTLAPITPVSGKPRGKAIGVFLPLGLTALVLGVLFFISNTNPDPTIESLTKRADDLYMRFTRADNEAAIALYERILASNNDHAPAQAGLANALVQRVIRWPNGDSGGAQSITQALELGLNQGGPAQDVLNRAVTMAERAVRLDPDNADAMKALGLTYSAQGKLDKAEDIYHQAIEADKDNWEAMINLGELYEIKQQPQKAIVIFEQAFEVMDRNYAVEPQRIGPWQAALGVVIGKLYAEQQANDEAELWYRRVLDKSPLEPEATTRLADLLRRSGDATQADALCRQLLERIGSYEGCEVEN